MRNMDGSEDLRQYGPFNVARAPTGQFVPKGSIKNPIEEFPESKTKVRRGEQRLRGSDKENEDDYNMRNRLTSRGRYSSSGRKSRQRTTSKRRSSKNRDEDMITKEGREDLRKYGPFNVDRAPTG